MKHIAMLIASAATLAAQPPSIPRIPVLRRDLNPGRRLNPK